MLPVIPTATAIAVIFAILSTLWLTNDETVYDHNNSNSGKIKPHQITIKNTIAVWISAAACIYSFNIGTETVKKRAEVFVSEPAF